MSVVFSGTNQGSFTSTGASTVLNIRSDVDWIWVYNTTQAAANQTTAVGVKYYWQRGFPNNSMWVEYKSNAANAANLQQYVTTGGFSLFNNTINNPGNPVAITAISGAVPPVVSTGTTTGLVANSSIVRLYNAVGAQQLGGFDFTVGAVVASTSFTLAYMSAVAAAAAPGANAVYRIIPYDPYFYPPTRIITNIGSSTLNGNNVAIVTLSVNHNYTVGQVVRFIIPQVTSAAYGMTQLNDVQATIVAVGAADVNSFTNTITVNVDVSSFTAFAWPLTADPFSTPAQVVPVGQNMSVSLANNVNPYSGAEVNVGYIGIQLQGGAGYPGGASSDVMYWVAGKSFNQ